MSDIRELRTLEEAVTLIEEWARHAQEQYATIVRVNEEIIELKLALEMAQARAWVVRPLPRRSPFDEPAEVA